MRSKSALGALFDIKHHIRSIPALARGDEGTPSVNRMEEHGGGRKHLPA
jgi:hypothetical protein